MSRSYWLVKSEPTVYAFTQLQKDKQTVWDGIRSFEARNNLRAMAKGDLILFYHSNVGKAVVGIARVKRTAYQDPSTDEDWSAIELEPVAPLTHAVSLDDMRVNPKLETMALLKKSRLSVTPVTEPEFHAVLTAGKTKLPKTAATSEAKSDAKSVTKSAAKKALKKA
jgi:predicted RNA-binding protein with PUA-like domain